MTEVIQKVMVVIPPEAHSIDDVDNKRVTSYLKENKVLQREHTLTLSVTSSDKSEKEVNYQTFPRGDESGLKNADSKM